MHENAVEGVMHFFGSKPFICVAILVSTFFVSHSASALGVTCSEIFEPASKVSADFMQVEFARTPNDELNGYVTNKVPITYASLRAAYVRGLIPYGLVDGHDAFFSFPKRGIMNFVDSELGPAYQIHKKDRPVFAKAVQAFSEGRMTIKMDSAFAEVIRGCAEQDRVQRNALTGELEGVHGTWITEDYSRAVNEAFARGEAHSYETWEDGQLIGGMYVLIFDGVVYMESMFKKPDKDNASKLAFHFALEHLKSLGYTWGDVQVAPADSKSLSVKWKAFETSRENFLKLQKKSQELNIKWRRMPN